MQRLSTLAPLLLIVATSSAARADAPITITINSNNAPSAAPGTVEPAPPSCTAAIVAAPVRASHRALRIGVFGGRGGAANTTTDDAKTGGIRASLDVFAHRRWALGIAGTVVGHDDKEPTTPPIGSSIVAYVAYTHPLTPTLDLRFELGGGVGQLPEATMTADATMAKSVASTPDDPPQQKRFLRVGEASITLTHMWNERWGIAAGPVFTVAHPSDLDDDAKDPHPAHTVAFFAAVERRL